MEHRNSASFFANRGCEYFPCHKGADPENFNCLFCYCPLYALGEKCGGNCVYGPGDIKDCSNCMVPHKRNNYAYIMSKYSDILEITKMTPEELKK